jgi:predicted PurR-regulated permease PerM
MSICFWIKIKTWLQKLGEGCNFLKKDAKAIGVVEVILILVVLIGLVIIFKEQLTELVDSIFEKITSESSSI